MAQGPFVKKQTNQPSQKEGSFFSKNKKNIQSALRAIAVVTDQRGNNTRYIQQQIQNEHQRELQEREIGAGEEQHQEQMRLKRAEIALRRTTEALERTDLSPEYRAELEGAQRQLSEIIGVPFTAPTGPSQKQLQADAAEARDVARFESEMDPNSFENQMKKDQLAVQERNARSAETRNEITKTGQDLRREELELKQNQFEFKKNADQFAHIKTPTRKPTPVTENQIENNIRLLEADPVITPMNYNDKRQYTFAITDAAMTLAADNKLSKQEALNIVHSYMKQQSQYEVFNQGTSEKFMKLPFTGGDPISSLNMQALNKALIAFGQSKAAQPIGTRIEDDSSPTGMLIKQAYGDWIPYK